MSEKPQARVRSSVVSSIEDDSLECVPDVLMSATPSNPCPSVDSKDCQQLSLQELIEAELTARLQPDSLETGVVMEQHQHTFVMNNETSTTNCTMVRESHDQSPFSLDSLMEGSTDAPPPHFSTNGHSSLQKNDEFVRQSSTTFQEDFTNAATHSMSASCKVIEQTLSTHTEMSSAGLVADNTEENDVTINGDDLPEDLETLTPNNSITYTIETAQITQETHNIETVDPLANSEDDGGSSGSIDPCPTETSQAVDHEPLQEEFAVPTKSGESAEDEAPVQCLDPFDVTNNLNPISDVLDDNFVSNAPINSLLPSVHVINGKATEAEAVSPQLEEFEKMEEEIAEAATNGTETPKVKKTKTNGEKKTKKKKKKKTNGETDKLHPKRTNSYSSSSIMSSDSETERQSPKFSRLPPPKMDEQIESEMSLEIEEADLCDAPQSPSPVETKDTPVSREDSPSTEDLMGINIKTLTANYLSATECVKKNDSVHEVSSEPQPTIAHLVEAYKQSSASPITTTPPTDLTPLTPLKNLKSAYESCAGRTSSTSSCTVTKDELSISLSELRNNYCSAAHVGSEYTMNCSNTSASPVRESGGSPVNIRALDAIQVSSECRICGKQVFQMEKIVAEKASWHKNCFRCSECEKQLTPETYQSHEGTLYCKPHFKELFRPKAVIQDPADEIKERSTVKPDYGLDDLQSLNVKQRFSMFENANKDDTPPKLEQISVQRSQSLVSRAARFLGGQEDKPYGVSNEEIGEFDEQYDEGEESDDEDEDASDTEEGENGIPKRKKKERPMSFSGIGDLKSAWQQKQRRENMSHARKEEIGKFRQMLCAGKNHTLKEMFESGQFESPADEEKAKEQINIDSRRPAKSLRERFEMGQPFIIEEDGENNEDISNKKIQLSGDKQEVQEIFKEAETAKKARDVFKNIDSKVAKEGGGVVMRSKSFAHPRESRYSQDGAPSENVEVGRDPNLIKSTDVYEDEVDCTNTKNILQMFKKMEQGPNDNDKEGPRPLKSFTPPPEGEDYGSGSESDDEEEYTDDEDYSDDDEDADEEGKPKYKDEILEMLSAKKAATLRAKFEKYETEIDQQNAYNAGLDGEEESTEERPGLDTARNLKAMFENKAIQVTQPQVKSSPLKVNRFV